MIAQSVSEIISNNGHKDETMKAEYIEPRIHSVKTSVITTKLGWNQVVTGRA